MGYTPVVDATDTNTIFNLAAVGVSLTLGVVEFRGWGEVAYRLELWPYGNPSNIKVVESSREMTVDEEEAVGGLGHDLHVCKGRKWAVLYRGRNAEEKIAIRPLGLTGGVCKAVDVTGKMWQADMINDDEVALSTRTVDYPSRGYQLIVPTYVREKSCGATKLVLRSLRGPCDSVSWPTWCVHKVDYTHFAEEDPQNKTLSVFSTDDFGHHLAALRIFASINGQFQCGNGLIALTQREGYLDLVDAVTGTWLLRQPFLPFPRSSLTDSDKNYQVPYMFSLNAA
ncbi:hypothetical protein Pelo_15649 [Pelomyxa schiedti]|nr:hypothetical protein Pelo_15649 [Pelomyxa schiedti]